MAVEACNKALTQTWGNPSSLHAKGLEAEIVLNNSRHTIADALGCSENELIFTSCATESSNTALKSVAEKYGKRKKKIIVSSVEHPSVANVMKYLSEKGYDIEYIHPQSDGKFHADDFISAVDENTCLVSCMLVNNENGYILPVAEIFKAVKRLHPDVICHCDAVQGFMKIPFTVKSLNCDLLSISAHKIYAPKGIGALYIKKGIIIHPLLLGGGQERKLRSGTECVPLISAFAASAEYLKPNISKNLENYKNLKKYLIENLSEIDGISFNSNEDCAPYIVNFSIKDIRSEIMLHFLEKKNIFVSSGSACSKGAVSGVLEEFGASAGEADSALRISFSIYNKKEDIDALVSGVKDGIASLRRS